MGKQKLSNEFLLSELIRANTILGRNPKPTDLLPKYGFPHYSLYNKRFHKPLHMILTDIGIYDGIDYKYWNNIDTKMKAYYFGFLLGDGWISNNYICIQLSEIDKQWLLNYKQNLNIKTNLIKCYDKNNHLAYRISQGSQEWANALINLGFNTDKTYSAFIPLDKLDLNLIKYILLGLFDADGCIFLLKYGALKFHLSGTKLICNQVKSLLNHILNLESGSIGIGNGNIYQLQYAAKKDTDKIFEYLYSDSEVFDYCLKRKLQIWEDYNV
jgi:hypothetical protein